jgi:hypothetical protein
MSLTTFGAQVAGRQLTSGILLPWVTPANGQSVTVKVIHENDQFLQRVPPVISPLEHSVDPTHGDYWSGTVDLTAGGPPGSSWGQDGRYLYRFCISRPGGAPASTGTGLSQPTGSDRSERRTSVPSCPQQLRRGLDRLGFSRGRR